MPNIKSAKKRVRVIATKTERNKACRSALRTAMKHALTSLENNEADRKEALNFAVKKLDQAASKGILHKNTAARKKSHLMKKLNAASK